MATAYAALLSVMQIIDHIQHHPRPPVSLNRSQVESLTANVTFLQEFLEGSNHVGYSKETDALEMRIAGAAYAVEDVMESHIVGQILGDGEGAVSVDFYSALQEAIDGMESIKKEVLNGKEMGGGNLHQQLHGDSSASMASSSLELKTIVVGFDRILDEVLHKLTWNCSRREIISITGMGGIGKTTLVKSVFLHQLVEERFDMHALVIISQEYEIRKILVELLKGVGVREDLSELSEYELGKKLYRVLIGRRYLVIMDDIWNVDAWDRLKMFLPENNNGSGIMITTRLSNLPREIGSTHNISMQFLDQDNSWKLFCKHVFGKQECPLELKETGKKIVENCKGLPLSISVVGGVLAKSVQTKEKWEHVAQNLNSIVNLEDNEHCLQILHLSYNSLPAHLKPCFLYMGGFESEVPVMVVVASWVAEGIVKPVHGKSLEETAKEYLVELIDRNLLLFDECSDDAAYWIFKRCILHDLLRDMCIREAQKQRFLSVVSLDLISSSSTRRITIVENTPEEEINQMMESASLVRSLRCYKPSSAKMGFPLLRVAFVDGINDVENIIRHVNLRLMFLEVPPQHRLPSSISRFWNLQALFIKVLSSELVMAPLEVWTMPQLRCIMGDRFCLPQPPPQCITVVVLENIHSIGIVHNFKCSEEVVKRIPNIKTLLLCYTQAEENSHVSTTDSYCLDNLGGLQELEALAVEFTFFSTESLRIGFPLSLKVLVLFGTALPWDDVNSKIGSLPLLEYLRLDAYSCVGATWQTVEGNFSNLRSLLIFGCSDLEWWEAESSHFPRLERLVLHGFDKLEEIPPSVGDIATLQWIEVKKCSESVFASAERIKEEQEEVGNGDLQVLVFLSRREEGEQLN